MITPACPTVSPSSSTRPESVRGADTFGSGLLRVFIAALTVVVLAALLVPQPVAAQSAIIRPWETTSSSESITIPTDDQTGVSYDFTIDWGDGSETENNTGSDPDLTHTYTSLGTYSVDVTGSFPNLFWTDAATRRGSRRPSSGETSRGKV